MFTAHRATLSYIRYLSPAWSLSLITGLITSLSALSCDQGRGEVMSDEAGSWARDAAENAGSPSRGGAIVAGTIGESSGGERQDHMGGVGHNTDDMSTGDMSTGDTSTDDTSTDDTSTDDTDTDGSANDEDNCPDIYNPTQSDIDNNGIGDACEPDDDADGIPNMWDPSPMDPAWPGRAFPDTVYAQTASALYALDVKSLTLDAIADFSFDTSGNHQITDIAIDRAGVLWAITFNTLWLCHPQTGECRSQARLPFTNFNGLTFVSGSFFGEPRDVLVGIDSTGSWRRLDFLRDILVDELLGIYPGDRSSGDAFSIEDVGTFASVKRAGVNSDIIINVNPVRPDETVDFVVLEGYSSVYGLAGWRGQLFAFDESGAVLAIDLNSREIRVLNVQSERWWGAAVSSVIRSAPPTAP